MRGARNGAAVGEWKCRWWKQRKIERERDKEKESERFRREGERMWEERIWCGFKSVKMRGRQPLVKEKYINSESPIKSVCLL